MVVMEYKVSLLDDFRIGDTIMITSKTSSGWKAMVNNKHEIVFEINNDHAIPLLLNGWILVDVNDRWEKMWICCKDGPFQVGFYKNEPDKLEKKKKKDQSHLENLIQIDEIEVVQATNPQNPTIRFHFKTQNKTYHVILPSKEGMVSNARLIMKALRNKEKSLYKQPAPNTTTSSTKAIQIPHQQAKEVTPISRSAPQAPIHTFSQNSHNQSHKEKKDVSTTHHAHTPQNLLPVPNLTVREYPSSSTNRQSPSHNQHTTPAPASHHTTPAPASQHTTPPPITQHATTSHFISETTNLQITNRNSAQRDSNIITPQPPSDKKVQIQTPPNKEGRASPNLGPSNPSPTQSQIGGAKWLANIKSIVNPKANSALNLTKTDTKKAQSVMMSKSPSMPELQSNSRNTTLTVRSPTPTAPSPRAIEPPKERKILTRVYWRDGTYVTVDVTPGITAKEISEFCTKKTKVAIFENLFCLYECLDDGTERILDPKSNVSELLMTWGEDSTNHFVCDLNLGTKKTVKTQLRKTLAVSSRADSDSYESGSDLGDLDTDFGNLDDLESEPTEEDASIAMMIQEMIKLKHQLLEEDAMIERLAVEEQEVDMLISRLANL